MQLSKVFEFVNKSSKFLFADHSIPPKLRICFPFSRLTSGRARNTIIWKRWNIIAARYKVYQQSRQIRHKRQAITGSAADALQTLIESIKVRVRRFGAYQPARSSHSHSPYRSHASLNFFVFFQSRPISNTMGESMCSYRDIIISARCSQQPLRGTLPPANAADLRTYRADDAIQVSMEVRIPKKRCGRLYHSQGSWARFSWWQKIFPTSIRFIAKFLSW